MNLKQLEAFVKVAETKSFSEAAKQLFLTQPTISAHVSALEKELNTCFLIRNTRGVELSESGKELYAYAVQMLEIEKTIKGRFGKEIKPEGNVHSYWCFNRTGAIYSSKCNVYISCRISW